jgi:PIN domain nuclease of toxin-antitoxin system
MNYLLDTHVLLWFLSQQNKISSQVLEQCADPHNQPYFSLISIWEIQIKYQLGKLDLDIPIQKIIHTANEKDILKLDVKEQHILLLDNLPYHHKDPFDRLIIAQAKAEKMTLISADKIIKHYDVNLLW